MEIIDKQQISREVSVLFAISPLLKCVAPTSPIQFAVVDTVSWNVDKRLQILRQTSKRQSLNWGIFHQNNPKYFCFIISHTKTYMLTKWKKVSIKVWCIPIKDEKQLRFKWTSEEFIWSPFDISTQWIPEPQLPRLIKDCYETMLFQNKWRVSYMRSKEP